ncbi:D-Ala-D-Ala carboxypeptidase family metallohydrolase [Henriciella marina]|uniref:D-Ala-D-Ala carboxypeptidase family metallohydrolase n=1 Tax=Henriciella marina TaxID=453851 RepID=UPI000382D2F8|nr:D-Ala-D-Ala carboxypeptidase family metallohydrolase [Henriciella marina]
MLQLLLSGTAPYLVALAAPTAISTPQIEGEPLPHPVWHYMAMPGEAVSYDLPSGTDIFLEGRKLDAGEDFDAPKKPGTYQLEFRGDAGVPDYQVTLFVLEPADGVDASGRLNGFRMGRYPDNEPRGYIRLDEGEGDINVSPSFRIGQFLCHQQPDHWPKYLLVSSTNLERLEILLEALNRDGITDADTFFVMSGYRSPFYNTSIGSAKLSRHMYGDATDIYVDVAPRDGVMDDLNADGAINKADADFLYDYAQDLFAKTEGVPRGGLGSYKANAVHGPFVHVDGRGAPARWGR